jgi:hypothetical protein
LSSCKLTPERPRSPVKAVSRLTAQLRRAPPRGPARRRIQSAQPYSARSYMNEKI